MEPHMIENELFSLVFVIWINHVGFILITDNRKNNHAKVVKC